MTRVLARALMLTFVLFLVVGVAPAASAARKVPAPVDWGKKAASELELKPGRAADSPATGVRPTAATIEAKVAGVESVIERQALRFTFLFEPYQAHGAAKIASGEDVSYSNLPATVLAQIDLRWLPFRLGVDLGDIAFGGYLAGGYSRQTVPLVAASGFRYDDTALNTFRAEGGVVFGRTLSDRFDIETRFGLGRIIEAQTSKYADVVASQDRPYLVGAIDLSYYLTKKFAILGSVARRTPLSDGRGSIAFDPFTVSGGFLVQVR